MTETAQPLKARHYKELLVWQKGMQLAREIYRLTAKFPPEERFGLASQMRRASVSVPSNIAEGQARRTTREFLLYLSHANGSLAELETQVLLALDLRFCEKDEFEPALTRINELQRMLSTLRRRLGPPAGH